MSAPSKGARLWRGSLFSPHAFDILPLSLSLSPSLSLSLSLAPTPVLLPSPPLHLVFSCSLRSEMPSCEKFVCQWGWLLLPPGCVCVCVGVGVGVCVCFSAESNRDRCGASLTPGTDSDGAVLDHVTVDTHTHTYTQWPVYRTDRVRYSS